jgi:long-subunit acyl-CoA synthetase (AMP-forming)
MRLPQVLRALVFRPILNKLGFDRLELVVSGGASLRRTAVLGRSTGSTSLKCTDKPRRRAASSPASAALRAPGNVGTAVDGVDVTLADDGECWCAARTCSMLLAER